MTPKQEKAVMEAGVLLKVAFSDDNMQICFNLARGHDNVNYNIKKSGILNPAKIKANL